jgi:hypothetical protein
MISAPKPFGCGQSLCSSSGALQVGGEAINQLSRTLLVLLHPTVCLDAMYICDI